MAWIDRIEQPRLAVCASLLLLNIAVGIMVIYSVVSNNQAIQSTSTNKLIQEIKMIYDEQLTKLTDDGTGDSKRKAILQEVRKQPDMKPAILNLLKPVAYLTGLDFDGRIESENDTFVRNWVPFVAHGGRQLMSNGMRYDHGSIIVPTPGVYAVESHVKFYTENNRRRETEIDFHHSIMRYNAIKQTSQPALADIMSENKNDVIEGGCLEYSSNIHGLLELNAGDQLIVKVSHLKPLQHDRDWHYFGLYMV
uniref:Tumor necrosis factor alpha n=1 Tax=Haliotis diversicolor TaxID=36095 RepID=E3UTM8_HALDV|nr:tumor necrosis factor alpha [Haliotis diversicolor]